MIEKTVWYELCEYCTAKAQEAGITQEDSKRILEQVRKCGKCDKSLEECTRWKFCGR